ncbi:MAG: TonB-dependent receptor [Dysgonamonadaceae bacterium]|jgi:hypothetical protein|nr:TonB-dependent receptor [Dysgonamonadaceae bacterium]
MFKKLVLTFFLSYSSICLCAQNKTISGYITDSVTGETLIGASVFDTRTGKGVASNSFGFYSLTMPQGEVEIACTYVGYAQKNLKINLQRDTTLNFPITQGSELQEVVVIGNRDETGVKGTQMSAINVPVAQIKNIPSLLGENDVIKALQLLPGVQAGTEGFAGFYVRGGGPDENLFLLDGVPLYDINHLGGFFSVFNADAIKSVTLYKGGFPARFGSRLSSVLDIRMNDGNTKKLHGNISVGLLSTKMNLEGPLGSEKTIFNISARRTYYDILAYPLMKYATSQASDENNKTNVTAGYYFYDINAKISHRLSENDRLFLSFYMGDDVVYANFKEESKYTNAYDGEDGNYAPSQYTETNHLKMDWKWGNMLTVLRWNHVFGNKLFMNATANFTRYRFDLGIGVDYTTTSQNEPDYDANIAYKSGIRDFSGKVEFDWQPSTAHDVKFGVNAVSHTFRPGVFVAAAHEGNETPIDTVIGNANIHAAEMIGFVEDNYSICDFLKANVGLHYSAFSVQNSFYNSLQPRVGLRALVTDNLSLKAGYTQMSQYIHLLSNNNISLPTDLWVPVTKRIKPMKSHQGAFGVFYNLNNIVDLSVEMYYKTMDNVLEYRDGATFMSMETDWESKVATGRGWAYGVEFLAQKTVGKTTGWVGYTWAKSNRKFDRPGQELNFGRTFPAKYDRRHDLSVVATHRFSEKIDVSGTWVYSTGDCATLALQNYTDPAESSYFGEFSSGDGLGYIDQRNNYRKPDYHRLDLGINFHKKKKYGIRTWNISIYNVYNNNNPFFIRQDSKSVQNPNGSWSEKKVLKQYSIFPVIPSVSYIYKF